MLNHELSISQIMRAEIQHYIRTKAGQQLRRSSLENARVSSPILFDTLLETYLEECTNKKSGPSHLELIKRLLLLGGVSEQELDIAMATPGNTAAIALYRDISDRGAGCHMLGAGAVEHYYCQLSLKVYNVYTEKYKMTHEQAETYYIHTKMDQIHADRAFNILDEAIKLHGWPLIEMSVRDAFVATSLHYDGMFQAAAQNTKYWSGVEK